MYQGKKALASAKTLVFHDFREFQVISFREFLLRKKTYQDILCALLNSYLSSLVTWVSFFFLKLYSLNNNLSS